MKNVVKCFKLKNGMDIIGKVSDVTPTVLIGSTDSDAQPKRFLIEKPLLIQAFPSPQGGIAVSMIPFLLFASPNEKNEFEILGTDYFKMYAPDDKLESGYLEQTSGIALVRGGNGVSSGAMKM